MQKIFVKFIVQINNRSLTRYVAINEKLRGLSLKYCGERKRCGLVFYILRRLEFAKENIPWNMEETIGSDIFTQRITSTISYSVNSGCDNAATKSTTPPEVVFCRMLWYCILTRTKSCCLSAGKVWTTSFLLFFFTIFLTPGILCRKNSSSLEIYMTNAIKWNKHKVFFSWVGKN